MLGHRSSGRRWGMDRHNGLSEEALNNGMEKQSVTEVPDCGLAPGAGRKSVTDADCDPALGTGRRIVTEAQDCGPAPGVGRRSVAHEDTSLASKSQASTMDVGAHWGRRK